jgi:hypothetical protein
MSLFRRKAIADLQTEAASDQGLTRALGPFSLTLLGIGAIIGTGIFVLTGTVAAKTNLYGALAWLSYRFGQPDKAGVYLLGSAGMMKHDYRSKTYTDEQGGNFELAWSAGAGVDIPAGSSVTVFIETRFFMRGDTRFIPIFAGIGIPVGKKK